MIWRAFLVGLVVLVLPAAASATEISWGQSRFIDNSHPYGGQPSIQDVACPSTHLCVGVEDSGVVTSTSPTSGAPSWHDASFLGLPGYSGAVLGSVTCASTHLCVVTDLVGDVLTSTNPAGGRQAWHASKGPDLAALSCPSRKLCIGVSGGSVLWTRNPAGGVKAWHSRLADDGADLVSIGCSTTGVCVAAGSGNQGNGNTIITSTKPTRAWMVIDFDTELNLAFSGAACPSARLCVVTDGSGDVLTSTRPASGRRQWRVGRVSGADRSLTCPSTKLCVSLGPGALAFSTHPAGGARTWHTTDLQTPLSGVAQVSCATLHLCVAVDWGDDVLESTRPTRGSAAWTEANLGQGSNSLTSISCPASGLCVAADDAGNVITSTDPAAGDWSRTDLAPVLGDTGRQPILSAVSCPSASFCATVSSAGVVLTSDDPTGSAAWSAEPASTGGLEALDCPSSELCVATDGYGNLLTTTTPSSGPWTSVQLGGPPVCDKYGCSYDALGRVSCEGDQFCAATDGASLWVSTDPTGGAGAWTKSTLPAPAVASTLACPAAGTCVLADGSEVMSTADATVPDPEWTMTSLPAESVSFPIGPPASASVSAISCVSTTMCVAVDHIDGYAFSGNPAGGTWTADRLDPPTNSPLLGDATLSDVSCSPDDQCVAIDETGHAYVGQLASP